MFSKIFEFSKKFRPIYNKYKHTLSEVTGIYGINKERKLVESRLYVRHKQNGSFRTYVLGIAPEVTNYLQEISAMTYENLRVLIDSALLSIVNLGGDFVPRTLFVRGDEGKRFLEIASKVNLVEFPISNR